MEVLQLDLCHFSGSKKCMQACCPFSLVTSCICNQPQPFCLNLKPILRCLRNMTAHEVFVICLIGPDLFYQIIWASMSLSSVNTVLSMGRSLRNNRVIRRDKYSCRKVFACLAVWVRMSMAVHVEETRRQIKPRTPFLAWMFPDKQRRLGEASTIPFLVPLPPSLGTAFFLDLQCSQMLLILDMRNGMFLN